MVNKKGKVVLRRASKDIDDYKVKIIATRKQNQSRDMFINLAD